MSKTSLTQALYRAKRQCPNRWATVFGERKNPCRNCRSHGAPYWLDQQGRVG